MQTQSIATPAAIEFNPARCLDELERTGTVMLSAYSLFSAEQLAEMERLCAAVPEEMIKLGDAGEPNDLFVGRFMVDKAGEMPTFVNRPHSDRLLEILQGPEQREFFKFLLGSDHFVRRCQVNKMVSGSFIGRHLDIDSNPDYVVSVVIQLGRRFGGGEFVVYPQNGGINSYKPDYGTVIISKCVHEHEVKRVTDNERVSLVYFYSPHQFANRRVQ